MKTAPLLAMLISGVAIAAPPAAPSSQPADPTLDWLMAKKITAATRPSTRPATTQPSGVFGNQNDVSRAGVITLNTGETITGRIATTAEKPVRIWVEAEKDYEDIPFDLIKTIEAKVVWERDEQEWHFKASGSDVKEYSGKSYPARQTQYKFTLVNGQSLEGDVVAPLYVTTPDGASKTWVLNKRSKGDVGQTLAQLKYVKSVKMAEESGSPP